MHIIRCVYSHIQAGHIHTNVSTGKKNVAYCTHQINANVSKNFPPATLSENRIFLELSTKVEDM